MSVPWIDSHCHLQDRYRQDAKSVSEVVAEASAAGVGGLVCIGTDAQSSREAVGLVEDLRAAPGPNAAAFGAWATVGLHPHDASSGAEEMTAVLLEALSAWPGRVVAVGECGLDYHYDHSPRAIQREVFATQIALANEHALALVVHSRESWDDTIDILRSENAPRRTVLHCFTGGPEEARRVLDLGAFVSFSGIVTFANASEVREAARLCPLDRLLVETDSPFLAPVPNRGKENRPAWVALVGEEVARLKGVTTDELAATTSSVTREVFSLG
jgi:TatD DNase family protein